MNELLKMLRMSTRMPLYAPEGATSGGGDGGTGGSDGDDGGEPGGVVLNGGGPEGDGAEDGTDDGGDGGDEGEGDDDPLDTVPENGAYEFQVDEENGFALSDAAKTAYSTAFAEAGLTQRQVNSVVDAHQKMLLDMAQNAGAAADAQLNEWVEEAKADPEMGKDWAMTVSLANNAVRTIANQGVVDELNRTGLGNHPAFIKMFSKVGKMLADDNFTTGDTTNHVVPTEKSWYGDTTPETKRG